MAEIKFLGRDNKAGSQATEDDNPTVLLAAALEGILTKAVYKVQERTKVVPSTEDRMLKAKEACEIMQVSEDWLYRHANKLPFTRKLADGVLRFSANGLQRWLSTRKV